MAQRRTRTRSRLRRATQRMGLSGGRLAATGLLVLSVAGAGVGVVAQQRGTVFSLERAPDALADDAQSTHGSSPEGLPAEPQDGAATEPETAHFRVHVDGAVASPGVVELEGTDLRVADAVAACGGLTGEADTTNVNLAEPLLDGSKIHIPTSGEQEAAPEAPVTGQAMTVGATGSGSGQVLVNINTATAEELQQLKGIGEVTAQAIVDERTRNGPFASPEDLMRVSGIGQKKYEAVQGSICV